jgi:anti-sigma factor RsiW
MYVPGTPSTPSATAQSLGARIAELVREFRQSHPDAGAADVEQAFEVARSTLRSELPTGRRSPAFATGVAAAVALAGVFTALQLFPGWGADALPMVAVGALVLGILVALVVRQSGSGATTAAVAILLGLAVLGLGAFLLLARSGLVPF